MGTITAWTGFALLAAACSTLLVRWVLNTPPGRRRWLALDAAALAFVVPVELAVYWLSGGGFFWPVFSIVGFSTLFGGHAWWLARRPDPAEEQLVRRVGALTATRRDALDTQAEDLRRIERDLHDGTQARLVSLALNLGLAETLVRTDPDAAVDLLAETRQSAGAALADLRSVMHGIRPGVLADRGLVEGIRALAVDLAVPVEVIGEVGPGLTSAAELAAYFAVAEALANVVKHSGANRARVLCSEVTGTGEVSLEVVDDGHGGADPTSGTGLRGVAARLAPFDGSLELTSPAGGPTTVVVRLPTSADHLG